MDSTKSDCPTVTTTISYGVVKDDKNKLFNVAKFLDRAPSGLILWNERTQTSVTFRSVERRENGSEPVIVTYDADEDLVCFDEYGRELTSFYGVIHNTDVDLFPDSSNLFWSTEKSPNLAAEIIFPRCTGSVIIDGDGDALLVGSEEYYYWSCAHNGEPYINTCRFHKMNYNGARFAEFHEANTFIEKLQDNGYDYAKGYVVAQPKQKNDKELKQRGFEYAENICKWVNSQDNIEVVSIVSDNREFTNSNFILFYYEK